MYNYIMISTILLSGGVGSRSGKDIPKQYCELLGKRIINYCLDSIVDSGFTSELIIVYGDGFYKLLGEILDPYRSSFKSIKLVLGGGTRQESVYNGLKSCNNQTVLLHESARPLITGTDLKSIIYNKNSAVTMGEDIPFTVLKQRDGKLVEVLNRDELFNVQLPQKFPLEELLVAHKKAFDDNRSFTDDSSLYFEYNGQVAVIKGSSENIKVTSPKDFSIAEGLLKSRYLK